MKQGDGGASGAIKADNSNWPRLQILGPLRVWRNGIERDPGPRQQALLLSLLLARAGNPVSTGDLIDLIWNENAPASALNLLRKYIGAIRRLLEPGLPDRDPGSFLLRRGSAYMFVADAWTLDLTAFRDLVTRARAARSEGRPDVALDAYAEALSLWRGPAADRTLGLDDEFFDASVVAAELAVSAGEPERVLEPMRLAATMAPLNEAVHAGLVSMLTVAGQHAEARSVYRGIRDRLATELGIDPGPALRASRRQPLRPMNASSASPGEARSLDAQPSGGAQPSRSLGGARPSSQLSKRVLPSSPRDGRAQAAGRVGAMRRSAAGIVGRADELTALRAAVDQALAGGTKLVILEGEPGVGKTRLLEATAAEAERRGARVAWGSCLEGDATPSMWPWTQAVNALLDGLPPAERERWRSGELGRLMGQSADGTSVPDGSAQFRLFEAVVAVVAETPGPVVLIIDDLQWADDGSLRLLDHLASRLPGGSVIVGALRDQAPAPSGELIRVLAAASRVAGHRRIRLGPLSTSAVAELVQRETGQQTDADTVRTIRARTAGNPFFVRELSRLIADGGDITQATVARTQVPSTVQDVVRDRLVGLDADVIALLRIAALIGRDVDLRVLVLAAELDVATCLEQLEPAETLGMLLPVPGDPFSFRFAHDLVRESVVAVVPRSQAGRLHLRIADALERIDGGGESAVESRAHHLWAAGPLADPVRTVGALIRGSRHAASKVAFESAERQLRLAARVARSRGLAELELTALTQLMAVLGMRSGYIIPALDVLERAEELAAGLGREREATGFLFTRWLGLTQGIQIERSSRLAARLRAEGERSSDPILRTYGTFAWGMHQWELDNIGEAFRHFIECERIRAESHFGGEDPIWQYLQLRSPMWLAMMTALHGDVDTARRMFDRHEPAAGTDSYALTIWSTFASLTAVAVGDPAWALRVGQRGIDADPHRSFVFHGPHPRLARLWALAATGADPAGAADEAGRIIHDDMLDPPRSMVASWFGALAEMWLAAGDTARSAVALDRADELVARYGQLDGQGMLLLRRARLMQARGEPVAAVRAVAERARARAVAQEAHLFAARAGQFLAEL